MITVGYVLYSEPLHPTVALGAVLVITANAVNLWAEWRYPNVRR